MENTKTISSPNIDILVKLNTSVQILTHELLTNLDNDVNLDAPTQIKSATRFGIVTMSGLVENMINDQIEQLKNEINKNNGENKT